MARARTADMVALDSDPDAIEPGERAPPFELPGTDGKTYALSDFDDHGALLVVFTCNHCPYARAAYDAMNAIADDYGSVAVVGINPNDAEEYPEDSYEKMVEAVECRCSRGTDARGPRNGSAAPGPDEAASIESDNGAIGRAVRTPWHGPVRGWRPGWYGGCEEFVRSYSRRLACNEVRVSVRTVRATTS